MTQNDVPHCNLQKGFAHRCEYWGLLNKMNTTLSALAELVVNKRLQTAMLTDQCSYPASSGVSCQHIQSTQCLGA